MFEGILFICFLIALFVWRSRSQAAGALPEPVLRGAEVAEVVESRDFYGHSFMRLLIQRETGRRHDPFEHVEAVGLVPRLWAPHIRSGVKVLVENVVPPLDRLILTDHVWDAADMAAALASHFEDAEVEVTEDAITVAGLRNGVEASVELDREGLLLFDVVTPLRAEDEDLTVDFEAFDEDSVPTEPIIAPGIAGSAWIVGAEDRPVPDLFRKVVEENPDAMRAWLEHFDQISIFDGRADTYTQLLVPEWRIALDLLDVFIGLTRFDAAPEEMPEDREGWW